jgi:hypothetical protein
MSNRTARTPASCSARMSSSGVSLGICVTPANVGPSAASASIRYPWSKAWNDPGTTAPQARPQLLLRGVQGR